MSMTASEQTQTGPGNDRRPACWSRLSGHHQGVATGENQMGSVDAGVTLHVDEDTTHEEREGFRDALLGMDGVMAAAYHDDKPHLMVVVYDPSLVKSITFIEAARTRGLHAELIA
jgi:hypothetical protein